MGLAHRAHPQLKEICGSLDASFGGSCLVESGDLLYTRWVSAISFDHCYQKNLSAETFYGLKDRGFFLDPNTVEHPGGNNCRFVTFQRPGGLDVGRKFQYLEFCQLVDLQALRELYDPLHPNAVTDTTIFRAGFSLICDSNLESFHKTMSSSLLAYEPKFSHKNYEWKTDDKSRLPGWNFVSFEKSIFEREIYVWLTEYEKADIRPLIKVEEHPNTCQRIEGFVWNYSPAELSNFLELTKTDIRDGKVTLRDGSIVFLDGPSIFDDRKTCPFHAVVLSCEDWSVFEELAKPDLVFEWQGRKTGLIKLDDHGWDILVRARN